MREDLRITRREIREKIRKLENEKDNLERYLFFLFRYFIFF